MPFKAGGQQGNAKRADTEEDAQQVQHWSTLLTIKVGHERVRASVQSTAAKTEQNGCHSRGCERVRERKP